MEIFKSVNRVIFVATIGLGVTLFLASGAEAKGGKGKGKKGKKPKTVQTATLTVTSTETGTGTGTPTGATTKVVGQGSGKVDGKGKGEEPWLKVSLQPGEIQTIQTWFEQHPPAIVVPENEGNVRNGKGLPPGLQKKLARGGTLPPGWQKKVAAGEVMSDDIYSCSEPLPGELVQQLPPAPPGTVMVKLEGKVVRLIEATKTIADILDIKVKF